MGKRTDIELVQGEDGVYAEKTQHHLPLRTQPQKKKHHENVESFLDGVDKGLDFLEEVDKRIDRFLGFKKKKKR